MDEVYDWLVSRTLWSLYLYHYTKIKISFVCNKTETETNIHSMPCPSKKWAVIALYIYLSFLTQEVLFPKTCWNRKFDLELKYILYVHLSVIKCSMHLNIDLSDIKCHMNFICASILYIKKGMLYDVWISVIFLCYIQLHNFSVFFSTHFCSCCW